MNGTAIVSFIVAFVIIVIIISATTSTAKEMFTKAAEAKDKMQIEADRESLLSEVVAAYDVQTGFISFEELNEGIKNIGFTGFNGEYTSKSGNKFYVNETSGIITLAAN